jgi:hypothetical protein
VRASSLNSDTRFRTEEEDDELMTKG